MNTTKLLCGLFLLATAFDAAHAQTRYPYSYAIRLHATPAGQTATLTRVDDAFVYPGVALTPTNCPATAPRVALRTTSVLRYVGPRRLELRLPTVGSSTCVLVGAFDLAILDDPPIMPDPGPPGQITGSTRPLAELDAGIEFGIHPGTIAWGGAAALSDSDAVARAHGVCTFKFAYFTRNLGELASPGTSNALERSSPSGDDAWTHAVPPIVANGHVLVSGEIKLPPGPSTLTLYVDEPNLVEEVLESNVYAIDVDVKGDCLP